MLNTDPKREFPLALDNGELLEPEIRVKRVQEHQDGRLIEHPGINRRIKSFRMKKAALTAEVASALAGLQKQASRLGAVMDKAKYEMERLPEMMRKGKVSTLDDESSGSSNDGEDDSSSSDESKMLKEELEKLNREEAERKPKPKSPHDLPSSSEDEPDDHDGTTEHSTEASIAVSKKRHSSATASANDALFTSQNTKKRRSLLTASADNFFFSQEESQTQTSDVVDLTRGHESEPIAAGAKKKKPASTGTEEKGVDGFLSSDDDDVQVLESPPKKATRVAKSDSCLLDSDDDDDSFNELCKSGLTGSNSKPARGEKTPGRRLKRLGLFSKRNATSSLQGSPKTSWVKRRRAPENGSRSSPLRTSVARRRSNSSDDSSLGGGVMRPGVDISMNHSSEEEEDDLSRLKKKRGKKSKAKQHSKRDKSREGTSFLRPIALEEAVDQDISSLLSPGDQHPFHRGFGGGRKHEQHGDLSSICNSSQDTKESQMKTPKTRPKQSSKKWQDTSSGRSGMALNLQKVPRSSNQWDD